MGLHGISGHERNAEGRPAMIVHPFGHGVCRKELGQAQEQKARSLNTCCQIRLFADVYYLGHVRMG